MDVISLVSQMMHERGYQFLRMELFRETNADTKPHQIPALYLGNMYIIRILKS